MIGQTIARTAALDPHGPALTDTVHDDRGHKPRRCPRHVAGLVTRRQKHLLVAPGLTWLAAGHSPQNWLARRISTMFRAAWGLTSANCSCSVDPSNAVVEDAPPAIACGTSRLTWQVRRMLGSVVNSAAVMVIRRAPYPRTYNR